MKNESVFDVARKLLLNSSLNISKNVFNCISKACDSGVVINKKIILHDYNCLGMGFGLKALEPIPANIDIFRVPLNAGLNGIDMVDMAADERKAILKNLIHTIGTTFAPEGPEREKMRQTQSLVWQVILNNNYEAATNNALVASFPHEDLTQIIYMNKELIDNLSSLNMKLYITYTTFFYKTLYEMITKDNIFEIDIGLFIWAYSNVLARKLTVEAPKQNIEVLIPIVDYINHSSSDPNVVTMPFHDYTDGRSYLQVTTIRDIEEGEQLLRHYGDDTNRNYMNKYGFFDIDNKRKELNLFYTQNIIELVMQDPAVQDYIMSGSQAEGLKQNLFKSNNVDMSGSNTITLYPNKFETNILKYLRIWFLDESQCLKAEGHDFAKIFSKENEIKVYKFLKVIFDKHLSLVKYNNYTDKIDILGVIDTVDKFKMKNLYLLEEEEQFLLSKNVDYINKKLNTLI
jgi:hypothetical protein